VATDRGVGIPAFTILNPEPKFAVSHSDYSAFLGAAADAQFVPFFDDSDGDPGSREGG
jgi:hypothetical protein